MADIVLLDGGMGQELIHRSRNKHPRDWSATYLMEEPDLVRRLHLDFVKAGARIITLNTYTASFTRMRMTGGADRVPELHRIAGEVARAARDDAGVDGEDVLIAGCLPPLNGSYRPERVRAFEVNLEEYRSMVALQAPVRGFVHLRNDVIGRGSACGGDGGGGVGQAGVGRVDAARDGGRDAALGRDGGRSVRGVGGD